MPSISNNNVEKSVQWIAQNGLCSGCGTCQPVCPVNCIEISLAKDGQYRPQINKEVCTNCGLCFKACPFSSLNYRKSIAEPIMVYSGYSTNNDIRRDGASGGLITQLLVNGLSSSFFDAVVVVSGNIPSKFQGVICTTPEEVVSAKGSKYVQISLNLILKELESSDYQRICYVGLPCHIRGLKKYLSFKKKLGRRIVMTFSLVCGQTLKWTAIDKQLSSLNVKEQNIANYTFRGNGWPGCQTIKSDEQILKVPHTSKMAMGGLFSSTLLAVDACMFCDDHFGKDADISFCDAWHSPQKGKCDGISTALCYSVKGLEFLKEMNNIGEFNLEEDSFQNVLKVQGHMKPTGSILFLLKLKRIKNRIVMESEIESNILSVVAGSLYNFTQFLLSAFSVKSYPVSFLALTRGFKKLLKF